MKSIPFVVFILLSAVCILHGLYYFPVLPTEVPSHFGPGGEPDAWSSKTMFISLYIAFSLFITALFTSIGYGIYRIPDSLFNLPRKRYWLSENKRENILDTLFIYVFILGVATLLLMIFMFEQSFRVSLGTQSKLYYTIPAIGIYILFVVMWCISLVLKFRK